MKSAADPARAIGTAGFFKTGPGEYGEGDKFLGITVPEARRIARAHRDLQAADRLTLLHSPWHEERAVALMLLVDAHARRANDFAPTVLIAERLLGDAHDLIHKAVGWLLREVGKRDLATLRRFLDDHAATMPRTVLRYAIERLHASERADYMGRKAKEPVLAGRAPSKRRVRAAD